MIKEFADALIEWSGVVGLSLIVLSVVYSALSLAKALINRNKPTV